jgi:hypothetical protein
MSKSKIYALLVIAILFISLVSVLIYYTNDEESSGENDEESSGENDEESSDENDEESSGENDEESSGEEKIIHKSEALINPYQHICNKCKYNILKNENASQFSSVSTVKGKPGFAPLCFNYDDMQMKCCTIKENNIHFGCPAFCYDKIKSNFNFLNNEDEYKEVLRHNDFCHNI